MTLQSTIKYPQQGPTSLLGPGIVVAFLLACVVLRAGNGPALDSILTTHNAIRASGTMSVDGTVSISGVPFDAILHSDTIVVSTGSPFGIRSGSVYACRDTFIVLNYLTRQAYDGHPRSQSATGLIPVSLGIDDIRSLVRGVPPGELRAFEVLTKREDGQILYRRRDTASVEFALVDASTRSLRQYQRKRADGSTMLNVTYGSFKNVNGTMIPFGVSVAANDDQQKVQFRFDTVDLSAPQSPIRPLSVPTSFTRTTLR